MVLSENMESPTMIPVGMKPSTYSWDIYKKTESMVHIGRGSVVGYLFHGNYPQRRERQTAMPIIEKYTSTLKK